MSIAMIEDAPSARGGVKRRNVPGKASPHEEAFRAQVQSLAIGWPSENLTKAQSHFLSRKRKRMVEGSLSPRQTAYLDTNLPGWRKARTAGMSAKIVTTESEYVVEAADGSLFSRLDSHHLAWLSELGSRADSGDLTEEQASFLDKRLAGWRTFGRAIEPMTANPGSIVIVNQFLDRAARGRLNEDLESAVTWLRAIRVLHEDGTLLPEIERIINRDLPGWRTGTVKGVIQYYSMGVFPGDDISSYDRAFLALARGGVHEEHAAAYAAWIEEIHQRWLGGTLTIALAAHLDVLDPSWRGTLDIPGRKLSPVTGRPSDAVYSDGRRPQVKAAQKAVARIVAEADQNGFGGNGHDLTFLLWALSDAFEENMTGFRLIEEAS